MIAELINIQRQNQAVEIISNQKSETKNLASPQVIEQQNAIQNLKKEAGRINEAIQMMEHGNLKNTTFQKQKASAPLAGLYGMTERDNWLLGGSPGNSFRV